VTESKSERPRILIVEDEHESADLLRRHLARLGCEVCGVAVTGQLALEFAQEHRPDLVLMDISIEGSLDGIATARLLREGPDIPVVYITSDTSKRAIDRAKLSEPLGYVVKPIDDKLLRPVVEVGDEFIVQLIGANGTSKLHVLLSRFHVINITVCWICQQNYRESPLTQ